jgi:hypothetical protein
MRLSAFRGHVPTVDRLAIVGTMMIGVSILLLHPFPANGAAPIKIAVFDFVLDDHSAGGGIIPEDDFDRANLRQSTDEAKHQLEASGQYRTIDTTKVASEVLAKGGVIDCNSCEVAAANKLGADEALIGVITRVNRTEYTLFIRVKNARTGAEVANGFTGLRMGANYAWPRGVTWLMKNQLLAILTAPKG